MKEIQVVIRVDLESRTAGLQVRHADHSAMLPTIKDFFFLVFVFYLFYLPQLKKYTKNKYKFEKI